MLTGPGHIGRFCVLAKVPTVVTLVCRDGVGDVERRLYARLGVPTQEGPKARLGGA